MTRDEARKKIIFALDVNSVDEIDRFAAMLRGRVGMFKIGKEVFTACGRDAVASVQRHGGDVFLDLKYHDIPNTVAKAMIEASRLGVRLVNLHALGGFEMMKTAVEAVSDKCGASRPHMLAVTVLTSSTSETLRRVGIEHSVEDMVLRLAELAQQAGMDGVVASPREVELIRDACGPDFMVVTPGVRPAFAMLDDQKRVMTPAEAVRRGVDYMVIGRPIARSDDPVAAVEMIVDEIVGECA